MTRPLPSGSIPAHVADFLRTKNRGATMSEIADAVSARLPLVERHSIRSAVLSNANGKGRALFAQERREGTRALYRLA